MKIVYFDYWTLGINNFLSFDAKLKSMGHDTMLFHIGSFNNPAYKLEQSISHLLCRDIRFYNTKYIYLALKKINPDIVIGLNTTLILDRVLILSCKKLGIKTIFLMCGDRPISSEIDAIVNSTMYTLADRFSKAKKYFSIVVPNYLYSSWNYNKKMVINFTPLKVLLKTFYNPSLYSWYPPLSIELIYDKCLVYANKYINYYRKLGYQRKQIKVVGNPKNDYFFNLIQSDFQLKEIKDKRIVKVIVSRKKYALYLEDSFQESKIAGWTYDYLNSHLQEILDRLRKDNILLIVKVHPTTNLKKLNHLDSNILFMNSDLEHLIYYSSFCIGHISSTVNLAILLKKPILIPKWDKSKHLPDYFIKHGVAKNWMNIDDEYDLEIDNEAYNSYIKENITITSPDSINLIIKEIIE